MSGAFTAAGEFLAADADSSRGAAGIVRTAHAVVFSSGMATA